MGFFGPYEFKTKTGKKFFLHVKDVGKTKFYYFSKDQTGALGGIPAGYEVGTSEHSELPFLRKKGGPKKDAGSAPAATA